MYNFSVSFHLYPVLIHWPNASTPKYVQNWRCVIQTILHIPFSMKGTGDHGFVLRRGWEKLWDGPSFLDRRFKTYYWPAGPIILLLQLHKHFLQVSSWTSSATLKDPGLSWLNCALTVLPIFEQCPHIQCACSVKLQQQHMKLRTPKEQEGEK